MKVTCPSCGHRVFARRHGGAKVHDTEGRELPRSFPVLPVGENIRLRRLARVRRGIENYSSRVRCPGAA